MSQSEQLFEQIPDAHLSLEGLVRVKLPNFVTHFNLHSGTYAPLH